jgi:tetratricopeptide (TPR) repeat protein
LATVWNNLGSLATQRKDFKEAAEQYQKSAALWLRTLGPNSPQYATTLSNIGSLESLRGHHKQAQQIATRALAIDRAYFGPNHPHLAADLANLGDEYFYRNKVDRAIELFLEAESIQEKSFGPNSLSLARILDNLAAAYQKSKRLADAKFAYEKAIRIFELQQPAVAPQFAVCLHHYALLLRATQDFGKAELTEVRATRLAVQSALSGQPTPTAGGLAFVQ